MYMFAKASKPLLCFLVFFMPCNFLRAQEDSPVALSTFFGLTASKYEPAVLGRDFSKLDINIFNAYAWFGNTAFSYNDIRGLIENGINDTPVDVDQLIDQLRGKNRIGLGATVDLFHVGYRHSREERVEKGDHKGKIRCPGDYEHEEKFTVSFGISDRVESFLKYDEDIFRLYYITNYTDLLGTSNTFDAKASSFYTREYAVGFAMPLPIYHKGWDFRIGVRAKYIQGLAAAWTKSNSFTLDVNNDLINPVASLAFNYDAIAVGLNDFHPLKKKGWGLGTDIGVTAHYKERWYVNANLLDLAFVRWNKDLTRYTADEVVTYTPSLTGANDDLNQEVIDHITDSAQESSGAATMPYPLRLRFHGSYRIPSKDKDGVLFHKHSLSFTYIQGLIEFGNSTHRPYMAVGYDYSLMNWLEAGANIGFSGFNNIEIGAFLAVRAHFWHFGVGSGNLTGLLFRNYGTGGDVNVNVTFSF